MIVARPKTRSAETEEDEGAHLATGLTRTDQIRLRLADDIVKGVLAPGSALDETELARRFEVSRTPVREAIRLLAASGLVEARPHRSAVVARPSGPALLAMFEALQEIEALCAALAAERATAGDVAALEEANRRLGRLAKSGDPAAYHTANDMFHHAIYTAAHNHYLADFAVATRARIAPFSRAQFQLLGRSSQSFAEHLKIIDAIRSRDRERAAWEMKKHIMTVHDKYLDFSLAG